MSTETLRKVMTAMFKRRGFDLDGDEGMNIPDDLVAEITADAEAIVAALPHDVGMDYIRIMESWSEADSNVTATLVDMAICVCLKKLVGDKIDDKCDCWSGEAEITITSADLRAIMEQFTYERTEEAGSWTIKLRKLSEISSAEG